MTTSGFKVKVSERVRPALKLNLEKVEFCADDTMRRFGFNVTGVTLDKTDTQVIEVNDKVSFTANVAPNNATDSTVKWSISGTNPGAIKLYSDENCTQEIGTDTDSLTVFAKGISVGTVTVTVTATNGTESTTDDKTASCDVTVSSLADVKANATTEVNNVNSDDYITEHKDNVTNAKNTALAAIDAATTIEAVETALSNFRTAIAGCTTKVDNVKALINALPIASNVTTANETAITSARTAYNNLSDTQKALVSAELVQKLEAAESALALEKDKASFESYKTTKKTAAGNMAEAGDSAACSALITKAQTDIDE